MLEMSGETRSRKLWTEEEDGILRVEATRQCLTSQFSPCQSVIVHSSVLTLVTVALGSLNNWTTIATKLPSRTNKDCRKRWSKICNKVNRGAWSEDEDARLLAAVEKHGCG